MQEVPEKLASNILATVAADGTPKIQHFYDRPILSKQIIHAQISQIVWD